MKNELVRWTKDPIIVSPDLVRRKDSITKADSAWVYWTPLAAGATLPFWLLSYIWVSQPYTMQNVGKMWFAFNTLLLAVLTIVSLARMWGVKEPLRRRDSKMWLSYEGRKRLAQYDRNRKRSPQQLARGGRYAEADREYSQYSVWSEGQGNGVQLAIIEHEPAFPKWRVKEAAYQGTLAKRWLEDPDFDALNEQMSKMEQIAQKMEDEDYQRVVKTLENKRQALLLRR